MSETVAQGALTVIPLTYRNWSEFTEIRLSLEQLLKPGPTAMNPVLSVTILFDAYDNVFKQVQTYKDVSFAGCISVAILFHAIVNQPTDQSINQPKQIHTTP